MTCYKYGYAELSQFIRQEETEDVQTKVLEHLNLCADCHQRLLELEEILEEMPHGVRPVQPPDSLRERTLNTAFHLRSPVGELKNGHTEYSRQPEDNEGSKPREERQATPPRRLSSQHGFTLGLGRLFAGTSAALLAIAAVLSVQLVQAQRQVADLTMKLSNIAVNSFVLQPTGYAERAIGKAIVERKGAQLNLYLLVDGTKPTQGKEVYHVWLWKHGNRVSAGVFTVGSSGQAVFKSSITGTWSGLSGIGITLEPNASTTTPKGPKVFGAQL